MSSLALLTYRSVAFFSLSLCSGVCDTTTCPVNAKWWNICGGWRTLCISLRNASMLSAVTSSSNATFSNCNVNKEI